MSRKRDAKRQNRILTNHEDFVTSILEALPDEKLRGLVKYNQKCERRKKPIKKRRPGNK